MKTELTQEKKRIKIAEACGWHGIRTSSNPDVSDIIGMYGPLRGFAVIPDYFNDLNATHYAEKVLTEWQLLNYYNTFLFKIVSGHNESDCALDFAKVCSATAEQRAEAFGKTLGLW